MNILILGEYSGFAKNLKKGFEKLGDNAVIVTDGNGAKKIGSELSDIRFSFAKTYYILGRPLPFIKTLNCVYNSLLLNLKILKLNKFDLVLIINAEFVFYNFFEDVGVFNWLIKRKLKKNGKVFLSACSYDPAFYEFQSSLKYSPFITNNANITEKYCTKNHRKLFKNILRTVDLVIPIDYNYRVTMKEFVLSNNIKVNISNCVILPFDVDAIAFEITNNEKVIILHGLLKGLNRELLKGSNHILKGLELVKEKYPNLVEVIIPQGLGFDEYMKVFKSADIILDQTYSYGLGMNAVIALSYGKVLLGGNEPEYRSCLKIEDIPVVNIVPDENQIFLELEKLILNKKKILDLRFASRNFAEKYIACEVVAQQYIKLFKSIEN